MKRIIKLVWVILVLIAILAIAIIALKHDYSSVISRHIFWKSVYILLISSFFYAIRGIRIYSSKARFAFYYIVRMLEKDAFDVNHHSFKAERKSSVEKGLALLKKWVIRKMYKEDPDAYDNGNIP